MGQYDHACPQLEYTDSRPTTYIEVVEHQARAEDVWVYTYKVGLLRVHHHLDSLAVQGKVPLLKGTKEVRLICFT